MSTRREEFLAGERPDDVALYVADGNLGDRDDLGDVAEVVDGGVVLVVSGRRGRKVFADAIGVDAMGFARTAMERKGSIDRRLSGGSCPEGNGADHQPRFIFAFAEEENEAAGGLYAQGDVIHAYARCTCEVGYSDRWLASEA